MRSPRVPIALTMLSVAFAWIAGGCEGQHTEGQQPGDCTDAADNDADGLFDCDDDSCVGSSDCAEDDDTGGGDSDYVFYEGDPGDWEAGEAISSLPCGLGAADIWSFWVDAGQTVTVVVDTMSAETTFDPTLTLLIDDPSQSGVDPELLGEGDDEISCSFAPPSGACPRVETNAGTSGIVYVVIGEKGICFDTGGLYRMTAQVDGSPAPLTIVEDDDTQGFDGEGWGR